MRISKHSSIPFAIVFAVFAAFLAFEAVSYSQDADPVLNDPKKLVPQAVESTGICTEDLAAAMALMVGDFPCQVGCREYIPGPSSKAPGDVPFTGLIIDASALGIERSMSPGIIGENGNCIYGRMDAYENVVKTTGIVSYMETIEEAMADPRAGASPLIIQGLRKDDAFRFNVVISSDDAVRILLANAYYNFLGRMKVIIVDG